MFEEISFLYDTSDGDRIFWLGSRSVNELGSVGFFSCNVTVSAFVGEIFFAIANDNNERC